MRIMWRKLFTTAALAFMLCLTGLVMTGEAQAQRFVDNGNGTVTDTVTGLMWTKDANPIGKRNWHDAMAACGTFSISGIGGWRLPSNNELAALYHAIQGGHPFIGVQSSNYWSSTTNADGDIHAWVVFMGNGHVFSAPKHFTYQAWPVRAGH
jgi:hypothetical protein